MRCFVVVILVVLTVKVVSSCENICTFLYNNPDWESHTSSADTAFRVSVTAGSVTGIVTASFDTFSEDYGNDFDFLRFLKDDDEKYQPIFFKITLSETGGFFVGKLDDGKLTDKIFPRNHIRKSIQISDQEQDFYKIYIGDPGVSENWNYNYGSSSKWDEFRDIRLRDVRKIKSDGRCTVYKFISACPDPTPRLCDDEQQVSVNVNLDSSFTLSCSGSGAPFLDVTWTKDGNPTVIKPKTVSTTAEPDQKVQSTITIGRITLAHLGTWNCTILNKNFGYNVTKTYDLIYTYPATIEKSPGMDYYEGSDLIDTTLTWVVQGWPQEQVTMDCGDISVLRKKNITSVPPQLTFTLVLRMQNVVNCVLKDGENVMETLNITRVGYNCKAGEGGVGKHCENCDTGQTSKAGIGVCFPAKSVCTEGYWGVSKNCTSCPENQTSFNGTVKIQECFPDVSNCEEGEYGYETKCSKCPDGKTSSPKSKKIQECFPDVSNCEEGEYGYETKCSKCPDGKTSSPKSKKITDCFPDVSNCEKGQYGYESDCSLCPDGKTSSPKSKKVSDCYIPAPVTDSDLLIPISSGAGGLLLVLALIVVACLVVRRRRVNKFNDGDPIGSKLVMALEFNGVLSNDVAQDSSPENTDQQVEYATIIKQVPQDKQDDSCNVTYAVINKDLCGGAHQKNKAQELVKTRSRDTNPCSAESHNTLTDLNDDDAYAKLGDVKRDNSLDQEEDSVYSRLDKAGLSRKTQEFVKIESHYNDVLPGIGIDEDPLYANVKESNPKINSPKKTLNGLEKDESLFIGRPRAEEEEEDTYACVELAPTSRLRSRDSAAPSQAETVEYSSIVQFKRRKSLEFRGE
ncbi:hypothetical protein ACHWQZ_G012960 [Mnemiopsis leidyi]